MPTSLRLNNLLKYILVFLFIFLNGSFLVSNDIIPSTFVIILWIALFSIGIFQVRRIDFHVSLFLLLILLLFWVSVIINENDYLPYLKITVSFL